MTKANAYRGPGVVVGLGEIGRGLLEVLRAAYPDVAGHDVDPPGRQTPGPLHVCFPWHGGFVSAVASWVAYHAPDAVVVHSTVPVGTTREVAEAVGRPAFHSPVRGRHPRLADSIRTFRKIVGPVRETVDPIDEARLRGYLLGAGIETDVYRSSEASELAKLASTATYGLSIAWAQELDRWCRALDVDYDEVVRRSTRTYNEGYAGLGQGRLARPDIYPGTIGGHCVLPNLRLLRRLVEDLGRTTIGRPTSLFIDAVETSDRARRAEEKQGEAAEHPVDTLRDLARRIGEERDDDFYDRLRTAADGTYASREEAPE